MAKQKLGQNFLQNKNTAFRIAELVTGSGRLIVEIGPGKGIITSILAESRTEKIIAVEKDPVLYKKLEGRGLDGLTVFNRDILETDPAELSEGKNITLLGNIPYYISKEIIDWIINGNRIIEKGALMVQKEFFQKITSKPGTKMYNAQSVMFGILFSSKKMFEVQPGAFSPPPKVTSVVFTFSKRGQVPFGERISGFYSFLKNSFSHRRKTLINNLSSDHHKDHVSAYLKENNLPDNMRAEEMTPKNFIQLFQSLNK